MWWLTKQLPGGTRDRHKPAIHLRGLPTCPPVPAPLTDASSPLVDLLLNIVKQNPAVNAAL